MEHISAARRVRESAGPDAIQGLFGFSPAKQEYYTASSLMWLSSPRPLRIATDSAVLAIDTWAREPVELRSLDDEALAHVYLATARLKLGEIEGAMDAVRPIIDLPEDRQISWIRKRISELAGILAADRYRNSPLAERAREELWEYRR